MKGCKPGSIVSPGERRWIGSGLQPSWGIPVGKSQGVALGCLQVAPLALSMTRRCPCVGVMAMGGALPRVVVNGAPAGAGPRSPGRVQLRLHQPFDEAFGPCRGGALVVGPDAEAVSDVGVHDELGQHLRALEAQVDLRQAFADVL